MSQLGDALFTKTQQRVLGLLFVQPDRSFYTKEIIRLTGMGVATIKRELDRMVTAGILTMTKIGNQHHYQADPACPIFHELLGIIKKTFGVVEALSLALAPLSERIAWAFVFGSLASGKETSASDIDLMIIGDVGFGEAATAVYSVQAALGREVNPKVYSLLEWNQLLKNQDVFIKEVLAKPRMDVLGGNNELGKSGR